MESFSLPNLITMTEFSEIINKNSSSQIGINTLYKLIHEPGFPSIKIGERYYIMIERVEDWMKEQTMKRQPLEQCEVVTDVK